jgi:hypothetical protein
MTLALPLSGRPALALPPLFSHGHTRIHALVRLWARTGRTRIDARGNGAGVAQMTPDPLVGRAFLPIKELAGAAGWRTLDLELQAPAEPCTLQDEENKNNPYWLPLPRQVMVQSWPGIIKGGAQGGSIQVCATSVLQAQPLHPHLRAQPALSDDRIRKN